MVRDIFDKERLPPALCEFLQEANPWWEGKPGQKLPPYKRWAFRTALGKFSKGIAPFIFLRGPRQVGKTTLQLQLIEHLLDKERVTANRILRIQFDEIPSLKGIPDPILSIARWYQNRILKCTFNEAARKNEPSFLFLDEVQNLPDWAPQVKALVDLNNVKVMVTGSSALRIEAGRDSLAGRITPIELGTLLLREIAGLRFQAEIPSFMPENGLESLVQIEFWQQLQKQGQTGQNVRNKAFSAFSERGGYPMAQARADLPWAEVADQLNETVIQRAIQHDLRIGARGQKRDPQLLEEVFRLACRCAGQCPGQAIFSAEIKQALHTNIGWQRILAYLRFLDAAMLVKLINPLELRLKRRKGAHKICLCDHGLRASWLQEKIPLDSVSLITSPHLHDLAGHLAESIAGYFLAGIPHLDVAHFPERGAEPEVDFILTIGEKRIPIEVKYRQRIDRHRDTVGLRSFIEKAHYNAPFGILVTLTDDIDVVDPRIIPVSLPSLLPLR